MISTHLTLKKRMVRYTMTVLVCLVMLFQASQVFAVFRGYNTTPMSNAGKKWRIGYVEGGPYNSYQQSLTSIIDGLMGIQWIKKQPIPKIDDPNDTAHLWQWLSTEMESEYIEFVEDAYWSSNWDEEQRPKTREAVLKRLNEQKDIDMIFAMGTWAGQDMANCEHNVPVLVISTTDAVSAGIVKSNTDSGYKHVIAKVDSRRHERQVELFHDIIGFNNLGIAYENTMAGRGSAAIDSVYKVAKQRNFNVTPCFFGDMDAETPAEKAVACYTQLAQKKVDAVYITRYPGGVTLKNLPAILAPLTEHKIPTFSQGTSEEVEHGVLFSIALARFKYIGQFYARTISTIFNGAQPGDLPQEFRNPPKIAINLKAAQLIDYDPPIDILGAADEIYQEIKTAE